MDNKQFVELNPTEFKLLTDLHQQVQIIQNQLNVAITMAMAGRNISKFTLHNIEDNKIFYSE